MRLVFLPGRHIYMQVGMIFNFARSIQAMKKVYPISNDFWKRKTAKDDIIFLFIVITFITNLYLCPLYVVFNTINCNGKEANLHGSMRASLFCYIRRWSGLT